MADIKNPGRSTDMVENSLIRAMLEGEFAPGSALPPERELAARLGVARPTLREAMNRLGRDGWLSVRKGQPALVSDFWREGNLNTLVDIARNTNHFSRDFIVYLLEIRAALAPAFTREAVRLSPARVVAVLADSSDLEDSPGVFAEFDWKLQKKLAELSGNPVYLLILNSFDAIYIEMAGLYFSRPDNRRASKNFYRKLLEASMASDAGEAGRITGEAMEESILLWGNGQRVGGAEDVFPPGRRD